MKGIVKKEERKNSITRTLQREQLEMHDQQSSLHFITISILDCI